MQSLTIAGDGPGLIAHPIESVAVKLAYEWYASGQFSDLQIAQRLNDYSRYAVKRIG